MDNAADKFTEQKNSDLIFLKIVPLTDEVLQLLVCGKVLYKTCVWSIDTQKQYMNFEEEPSIMSKHLFL